MPTPTSPAVPLGDLEPLSPPPSGLRVLVRKPVLWIALMLAVGIGAVAILQARGPRVTVVAAARTDIAQHVVASGRVRVTTRVRVAAEAAGRVVEVRVREGQTARPGDVLLRLDDAEARAAVAQARAALQQAVARVGQLQGVSAVVASEASREAAANLDRAEALLRRVRTLAAAGAVSRVDLEDAERGVTIARAQKAAVDARERATAGDGDDTRVVQAALTEAKAREDAAVARLAQTRVVAQQPGRILTRAVEPGDTVQPGITLLELAADGITELVIEPDERNLAWIRTGQVARASADAFPGETFEARVSYIGAAVDPRRGSVEIRLEVASPPAYLKPDMTVSVDLEVASKRNVVAVPSESIRGTDSSQRWVWTVTGGRLTRQIVQLGIRGDGHTEITTGLDAGAEVVLALDSVLVDGQRVRTTREAP